MYYLCRCLSPLFRFITIHLRNAILSFGSRLASLELLPFLHCCQSISLKCHERIVNKIKIHLLIKGASEKITRKIDLEKTNWDFRVCTENHIPTSERNVRAHLEVTILNEIKNSLKIRNNLTRNGDIGTIW